MKKFKKILKPALITLVSLIVAIGIYALSINFYVVSSQSDKIKTNEGIDGNYDCIIVLGCGVRPDGTPSHMLYDRIITGVELYQKGAAPVIIMSGDHGQVDYDEVSVMKEYAVRAGVPAEKIFLDHAGFSTYESMTRANKIFDVTSAVVVTQEYHLYRALKCAENSGINAVGVSADLREYSGQAVRDVREIIARNKDFLYCLFDPDPKFLGEKISLLGNGDDTN